VLLHKIISSFPINFTGYGGSNRKGTLDCDLKTFWNNFDTEDFMIVNEAKIPWLTATLRIEARIVQNHTKDAIF
jgi:hypothetical protein